MAVRETRASWRRLLFFFVCIAVGVARHRRAALGHPERARRVRRARRESLIAADVLDRDQPRLDAGRARDRSTARLAEAGATARTETIETPTMVRPADESKAVARMVGAARRAGARFRSTARVELAGRAAVLARAARRTTARSSRPELLTALGVAVGDRHRHRRRRRSRSAASSRASRGAGVGAFSLGPRVLIDYDDLPSTGPARLRQPRAPRRCWCACPTSAHRAARRGAAARLRATSSSTRGRTGRPTTRSGATSTARRTT